MIVAQVPGGLGLDAVTKGPRASPNQAGIARPAWTGPWPDWHQPAQPDAVAATLRVGKHSKKCMVFCKQREVGAGFQA